MHSGAYAGFRRGGVTRRVTGYDDGGGVSPAPAGMLPGMGGGQPIPPIYYNPATYAGAGAPVGKGVPIPARPPMSLARSPRSRWRKAAWCVTLTAAACNRRLRRYGGFMQQVGVMTFRLTTSVDEVERISER